jgi:hypothetical protein
VQGGPALQDVDELVLPRVGVAQGRHRLGRQARQVDAEVSQADTSPSWRFSLPAMRDAKGPG